MQDSSTVQMNLQAQQGSSSCTEVVVREVMVVHNPNGCVARLTCCPCLKQLRSYHNLVARIVLLQCGLIRPNLASPSSEQLRQDTVCWPTGHERPLSWCGSKLLHSLFHRSDTSSAAYRDLSVACALKLSNPSPSLTAM